MAQKTKGKKTSPVIIWVGIIGVLGVVYIYTQGDDTPAPKAAAPAKQANAVGANDAFLPVDYKATYPVLKIEAKDAFLPLIKKAPVVSADDKAGSLPSAITGGGDWSYDGTIAVDSHTQGLLDEVKTGESDFVSVGQHWKHGRIKKITDDSIVIQGDNGTTATMKVGEPSAAAATKAAPVAPLQVPNNLIGQGGGDFNVAPLPSADGTGFGGGNGGGRRGGGGRRNRGGGGGGGFGGFGG